MNLEEAHRLLGTTDSATPDDIRKAFRKKAAEAHPDKNPGDATAEARFKEINEAYQILSGTQQPSHPQYHDVSSAYQNMQVNFEDFFGPFTEFINPQAQRKQVPYKKSHVQKSVQLSFEESILGAEREFKYVRKVFCKKCKAEGMNPGSVKKCTQCNGSGMIQKQNKQGGFFHFTATTCSACNGRGKVGEACPDCQGQGFIKENKTAKVKIPPVGSQTDVVLRFPKEGHVYPDVISDVFISITPTASKDNMVIEGTNVIMKLPVPLNILLFGGERQVPIVGQTELRTIKINESSKVGDNIVLNECGVRSFQSSSPGKLVIQLDIEYPKKLTPELKEQLTKAYED